MPLTFGAVGDVIAVALLVKDILNALDSSRGAASEYRELKRELYILERVLLEVEHLFRECDNTPELAQTCETATRCIADCRTAVGDFLNKINKYGKTLAKGSTSNAVSKTAMKLRWTLLDKDEAFRFRGEIMAHTDFLNMLLHSANFKLMQLHQQRMTTSLSQTSTMTLDLLVNQGATLIEIRDRLEEKNTIMCAQEASLARIQDQLEETHMLISHQSIYLNDIRRCLRIDQFMTGKILSLARKLYHSLLRGILPHIFCGLDIVLAQSCGVAVYDEASTPNGDPTFIVLGIELGMDAYVALYRAGSWTLISLLGNSTELPLHPFTPNMLIAGYLHNALVRFFHRFDFVEMTFDIHQYETTSSMSADGKEPLIYVVVSVAYGCLGYRPSASPKECPIDYFTMYQGPHGASWTVSFPAATVNWTAQIIRAVFVILLNRDEYNEYWADWTPS